jgi:alpha-tubulin suppressor-like RCC1 family protein
MASTGLRLARVVLGLLALVVLDGCGAGGEAPGGRRLETGAVLAELSTVPTGVACVQLVLGGSVTETLSFAVTAGATPVSLSVGALPPGAVTVTGSAYDLACGAVTPTSVPSWVSAPVSAQVTLGLTTGIAVTMQPNLPGTVDVDFLATALAVGAGGNSTYALLRDGTIRAWGDNSAGQLGNGTLVSATTPVAVSGLSGVQALAPGLVHACALDGSLHAFCWGYGGLGQLGNGGADNASSPVAVSGSPTFLTLASGALHTCGTTQAGTLCWGYNASGQLGTCSAVSSLGPVSAPCLPGELVVSGSSSFSTMAFSGNFSWAAGENSSGQFAVTPTAAVTTLSGTGYVDLFVTAAASGREHTCVVEASAGAVLCAGDDTYGQVGNGQTSLVPVTSPASTGLTGAIALSAGSYHTCALLADGSVWCWGYNAFGEVGDGTGFTRALPTLVKGLSSGVISIGAGAYHSCAVKADGTTWCWGANGSGQLGDGTTVNRGVPTQVRL